MSKLIKIGEVSKRLGVSIDTLRRWDKEKKLCSIRIGGSGSRFYDEEQINSFFKKTNLFLPDIIALAKEWVFNSKPINPALEFYSENSGIFQVRLMKFNDQLNKLPGLEQEFSLISSLAGEIGNNSFDHNLGNWPDVPGVFFGYDLKNKLIVLADRGQGVLQTLKRVRPKLINDKEALSVAFKEIVSSREPEARGNGLKYVVDVIIERVKNNKIELFFQTGNAELLVSTENKIIKIKQSSKSFRGCLAIIKF